jgi:hypothetical protein
VDRFDFEFSQPLSWPLALLGVTPWTAHVEVTDEELAVRFGPWSLTTPLSNVEGASVTGPYLPFKVLGPHISLADRGVTFGTSWRRGVCVRFRTPVAAALPTPLLRHPAVTVTVAEPERLVALLERAPVGPPGDGDELSAVLAGVPENAAGTPVARPPATRTTPRPTARTALGGGSATTSRSRSATRGSTRPTPRTQGRAGAPAPQEHPTPADMPKHTDTEKAPGVTPPADEGLPGPDSEA